MAEEKTYTISQAHLQFAMDFHAKTWELLEKQNRDGDENERMVDCAHTSLAHWRIVGTALRHQRGEWLISRVYAVLGEGEPSLRHARRCYEILQNNMKEMADSDIAFAHEALARAFAVLENPAKAREQLESAQKAGEAIADADERETFFAELASGDWHGIK